MKRVLLAVCGLSPQVITETLYALHQEGCLVDAIRVITTREGKTLINAYLLSPHDGKYYTFLRDYNIDPGKIDFSPHHVISVTDENGREIDDIADQEDNELFLKSCMEETFKLTQDPDCAVYFSIAGGRKTMGACLAIAAQCYGRPQDRIYHVLVSPEFESNRNFFYPPPLSVAVTLKDKNGHPYQKETRYAKITLVPMPFFSIRDRLVSDRLKEPNSPSSLFASLISEKRPELVIDMPEHKLWWKGKALEMMPARLALLTYFALLKKECRNDQLSCRRCHDCYKNIYEILKQSREIGNLYRRLSNHRYVLEMQDKGIQDLTKEYFNSLRSKIRKDIERGLGVNAAYEIAIMGVGSRPDTRYGIRVDKTKIRVVL